MREAYANDLDDDRSLIAVSASSNRSKGDQDPAKWTPPAAGSHCRYAVDWVTVKVRWHLSADPDEIDALDNLLTTCLTPAITTTPPTTAAPPPSTHPPTTPLPTTAPPPPPTTVPPTAPPTTSGGSCHPSYPTLCLPPPPPDLNCDDVGAKGFPVLPPDPHGLDGNDNDGIGCES